MKKTKRNATSRISWGKLVAWVVGVEMIGVGGGLLTASAIGSWYAFLEKPLFSPPNWLFGPVWTLLYAMIGVLGYWLWSSKEGDFRVEKRLFGLQLGLNAMWSPVFFGLKSTDLGLVTIAALWLVILGLMLRLWPLNRVWTGWLVPYFLWVSFASVLNFSVWLLN